MSKSITSNNKKQNTNFGDESGKLMKQHSEGKKTTPMSHEIHSIENALLKNTITIAYTYKNFAIQNALCKQMPCSLLPVVHKIFLHDLLHEQTSTTLNLKLLCSQDFPRGSLPNELTGRIFRFLWFRRTQKSL